MQAVVREAPLDITSKTSPRPADSGGVGGGADSIAAAAPIRRSGGSSPQRSAAGQPEAPAATRVPLSRIQRLIGTRMLASKHGKPCFYLATRADVTELMNMRHGLSKTLGVKVTSNAFFVRALALAAARYPLTVGRFVELEPPDSQPTAVIQIADHVNVGFAVNSPQGLVVPVIPQAETRTLAEIAAQEKVLTNKARSNQLTLADLEGETIALSNLGAYDIDSFLGIVPPPVSTILTAGKVAATAVPWNGHVIVRKMVSLSLAVDQRVIPPEYAARFLQCLTEELEDPERLV